MNKSFITDSCQNKPLDLIDIKTNHGIEISKKIKKPIFVHIKLKKFFFCIIEKVMSGRIVKIKIIGPFTKTPKAIEIQ